MRKKRWFEDNPKKTIFLVVLVAFLVGDLLCGVVLISEPEGVRHAFYHHTLKTYFQGNPQWGGESYALYTNSLGFRDGETREVALSGNRHRIVIIGDSFVEGIGCPYQETFAGIADRKLDGTVEILNAGVVSYSPKLFYLKIKYLIDEIGLRFDELFVFIDISDIQDEIV